MEIESEKKVREYLKLYGKDQDIITYDTPIPTVEDAANAIGVSPKRIAKTLVFEDEDGAVMIVTSGESKIDNKKYKAKFGRRPRMVSKEELWHLTGFVSGGVSPFGMDQPKIKKYMDISLKRFKETKVFPDAGSPRVAVGLTGNELFELSHALEWVDLCKEWKEEKE